MKRSKSIYKQKGNTFLEKLLKRNKLKKLDVCRVLGCSNNQFHNICNDYITYLNVHHLYTMSSLFGVTPYELLWGFERSRLMNADERMTNEDIALHNYNVVCDDDAITPDSLGLK